MTHFDLYPVPLSRAFSKYSDAGAGFYISPPWATNSALNFSRFLKNRLYSPPVPSGKTKGLSFVACAAPFCQPGGHSCKTPLLDTPGRLLLASTGLLLVQTVVFLQWPHHSWEESGALLVSTAGTLGFPQLPEPVGEVFLQLANSFALLLKIFFLILGNSEVFFHCNNFIFTNDFFMVSLIAVLLYFKNINIQ